jgi:hypothetical protein
MMRNFYTLIAIMAVAVFGIASSAQAEDSLRFVKRYVQTANKDMAPTVFSNLWRAKVQKHLHNTPAGLEKEYQASIKMHELFLAHGGLNSEADINAWGDAEQSTSYTFDLNRPIAGATIQEHFGYGADQIWSQYQITVENEDDAWVVAGESFIGTPAE